jgi:UDP-glucose:glycoprotein glucosyltransferase
LNHPLGLYIHAKHDTTWTTFNSSSAVLKFYELDYLIVGGHVREAGNSPPRGVQLPLTAGNDKSIDDTLVVKKLGLPTIQNNARHFYRLEICEGHSREVFQLESAGNEGWESPTVEMLGMELQSRVSKV